MISIVFLLGIVISLIFIIFMVFVAARNKEGGESMIRHLYTYLVLFATLMMVIGGGISIFMATADLVSPTGYYQSFADYKQMKYNERMYNKENEQQPILSDAELKAEYDLLVEEHKSRQKQNAVNQIIKSFGFIVIPLPIFLYFNKLRRKNE